MPRIYFWHASVLWSCKVCKVFYVNRYLYLPWLECMSAFTSMNAKLLLRFTTSLCPWGSYLQKSQRKTIVRSSHTRCSEKESQVHKSQKLGQVHLEWWALQPLLSVNHLDMQVRPTHASNQGFPTPLAKSHGHQDRGDTCLKSQILS